MPSQWGGETGGESAWEETGETEKGGKHKAGWAEGTMGEL